MTRVKRPNPIAELTGQNSRSPYPNGIGLPGASAKFDTGGQVKIWPGNTFVCHVGPDMDAYQVLVEMQETVKRSEFSAFFTFLPAPSFHMTVFNGMSPGVPFTNQWPGDFDRSWSRDRVSAEWIDRLKDIECPNSFRVKMTDLHALHSTTMVGANGVEEAKLRQTRVNLQQATGLQLIDPIDGDRFVFHITLAYLICFVSETCARDMLAFNEEISHKFVSQMPEIELGPVEFCNFDSMHHFEPQLRLGFEN